ncbi:FtsK/SpoIIIE domain-containing protein [Nocardiopsis valliformis]|uniref:FtsK/SpoIIIE domain-containing protein n=1 Tax=Nocardiopsis valliformis TaxID=239974 RepID=UPI0003480ACC|nr:FtsK/SpoIIIE domain-containing protein [Nocardiopsis valliformis]
MSATHPEHEPHPDTEQDQEAEVIDFPTRTTVTETATDEAAHSGEIVDAEIVHEEPDPDPNTASSEVAVPAKSKARVVVPASVRTAATRTAEVAKRPDRLLWELLRHELVYGSVGTARGAGHVWRWMVAAELDTQLAVKPELVLTTRKKRRNVVLTGVGTTAAAGTLAWFLLTPAVPVIALLTVLAVAGGLERRRAALGDAEAGHAALGASPSGKEVKRVFVSAKLAKKADEIRIVGPVTRTDGAWEATLELPPGTTYKSAAKKRGELAGAIGVDEVQIALDPVKGHNGRVKLWCADEDPMQGSRVENPLATRAPDQVNFWTGKLFAGRDARGRAVEFKMVERSYMIGGEPGGGKSVASNNVLAWFFLDPRTQVYLADGKFGFDLMVWEPMAKFVLTDKRPEAMIAMLREVISEMDRRYKILRKIGAPKVTEAIAKKYDLHPIVVHIDEVQFWSASGDAKADKEFMTALADIVGRGRAAAIITGVITQRPAAEVVPTRLRDILSIRWALRCTTPAASDTILGTGWSGRGYSAALFEPDQRGAGYILAEGSSPVQTRAAFIDPDRGELQALADRAFALRKEAGTLPKSDERTDVRLLNAVLEAMGEADKVHSDMLVTRLTATEEFTDLTQEALAKILRPLGVVSKGVWAAKVEDPTTKTTRQGYEKEAVLSALERV